MSAGEPAIYHFADDGYIPNHPQLPVLIYRGVATVAAGAAACERLFARHGWGGTWRDGIYPFHHYHSTAHEVLGVAAGQAPSTLVGHAANTWQ